jgi:tRNA U54 and U55 pseudouridine synthase Pus10
MLRLVPCMRQVDVKVSAEGLTWRAELVSEDKGRVGPAVAASRVPSCCVP